MGTGYTRQSASEIVTGQVAEASDFNNEFNAIQAAFNSSTGHTHDGTSGEGPLINLTTSIDGVLPVVNGGIAAKHKIDATTAPTANDDTGDGYGPGSIWIDVTNDVAYVCVDATLASAVWSRISYNSSPELTTINLGHPSDTTIARTGAGQISVEGSGVVLDSDIGSTVQAYDATLASLAAFNTNGFLVQSSSDTFVGRTLAGTANEVTVTNGSGVSGNPVISLPSSITLTGKNITGGTFTDAVIVGTNTNDNASTGEIGQYIEAILPFASASSISSGATGNIASITLSAGDWDVWGEANYIYSSMTGASGLSGSITTTSNGSDILVGRYGRTPFGGASLGSGTFTQQVGPARFSVASNTTVYITYSGGWTGGSASVYGGIFARRVR